MKKWTRFGAAAVLALALCAASAALLLSRMRPAEDQVYDLSLLCWEAEAIPEDWVYDQKGWTVFLQEGDTVTELEPNGTGGFDRLDEPGQTFYFSRVLWEEVDSPTLRIEAGICAVAVFLDGAPLYTDCPEQDNRIGHLRLPMPEREREEPVVVTLPQNYRGMTLTVAQSTDPSGGELQEPSATVWPCSLTLYSGNAYESELTAESFKTAVPAALAFAAMALLLAVFAVQALRGTPDLGVLCGALTAFFFLMGRLSPALFLYTSQGSLSLDAALGRNLSLALLLVFLTSRLTGRRRWAAGLLAGALFAALAADIAAQITGWVTLVWAPVPNYIGLAGLAAALVCGVLERSWFFRVFCPLTAAGALAGAALGFWTYNGTLLGLLYPLAGVMTAAALVTALAEAVRRETARRTEEQLLAQRGELARSSYEVLRRQHEQVMMLRHDMVKHLRLLRQTTGDEKTAAYLDELIGQNEKIRPVVQSGNEMLDIILNGKLSAAADAGIAVEIVRMKAPAALPLSDAELCSLVMNLLDNAVEAAAAPGWSGPISGWTSA